MKKIILFSLIGILLVTGAFIAIDYLNKKVVSFNFDNTDYSIDILDKSENKIAQIGKSGDLRLANGDYSYRVIGDGLDRNAVAFTVKDKPLKVTVTSELSDQKRKEILSQQEPNIELVINTNYSGKAGFTIDNISLHERGDWASASLIVDIPQQAPDTYRVVLHRENDLWKVKVPPTIAINKSQYKDVPEAILYSLYRY